MLRYHTGPSEAAGVWSELFSVTVEGRYDPGNSEEEEFDFQFQKVSDHDLRQQVGKATAAGC